MSIPVPDSESDTESAPLPNPTTQSKKRKVDTRSNVWDHFNKILDAEGNLIKATCKYCDKLYAAQPKKHGTNNLKLHSTACLKNPHAKETRQTLLSFGKSEDDETVLTTWVFNQENVRKATAKMIIMDELPFKFVEGRGFKQWVNEACPMFKIPSRWTVNRDIFAMYYEDRNHMKKFFREHSQRVSLTTDTWTSVQRINYMCITAHYIDAQWKLNKKVISFVPIQSHKGEEIALALEDCLIDWGFKNVFTITVDNASTNDVAMGFLKKKLVSWGSSSIRAGYLHMRCIAHILNLIVQDGLKEADGVVKKLRDNVRWVRGSPARLFKFKELATLLAVEGKSSLCLDVSTRWNSTYMMLRNAIPYKAVFEAYRVRDATFRLDLEESLIVEDKWKYLESFVTILKSFYEMTLKISGSLYVTSNTYMTEISDLRITIEEMIASPNEIEKAMGKSMKKKFNKYWGDPENMNLVIFFGNILDPRDKLVYMQSQFEYLFGKVEGETYFTMVKLQLKILFEDYVRELSVPLARGTGLPPLGNSQSKFKNMFNKQRVDSGEILETKMSELDVYLCESKENDDGNGFDLLLWWKINSTRFPILSKLARDVFAVPISTVASESTFSTGGRVLDNFRSSLTPKIVEALICTQDWLRGPREPLAVEENLDDLEKFEEEIENLRAGASSVRTQGTSTFRTSTQASNDFGLGGFEVDSLDDN